MDRVDLSMSWAKGIVEWSENGVSYLSIPFTWNLPSAYSRCVWLRREGYAIRAGGPAVALMPRCLSEVAAVGGDTDALWRHNPTATFTTRGCIRRCEFCAVPKIEGDFRELPTWEAKPVVCDNNLLASSRWHFDRVIDSLKPLRAVDFNQGLDARLLNSHHIERLRELNLPVIRLAWDSIDLEAVVLSAIRRLLDVGFPRSRIKVYVLFGFRDTPGDALYRCQTLKGMGIMPNPQRYNPLDTLKKDSYVAPSWTERKLRDFGRYWSRQNWLKKIPFEEYAVEKRRKSLW